MYVRFSGRFSEKLGRMWRTPGGYRYWADEPGDDVMCFSVKIMLCSICQYFAGKSMPEHVMQRTDRAQAARKAEGLLDAWFESFCSLRRVEFQYLSPIDVACLPV